jgi:hypothetical protein
MIYKRFYSELGKLLYAVADIDGAITPAEKKALQEIIKNELVPQEVHKDRFGTDAAYYSEIEFEILDDSIADAETAFESFIDYIENHHTAFNEQMKRACLRVVNELSSAYHGKNKKEKVLIEKLKKKLEAIPLRK